MKPFNYYVETKTTFNPFNTPQWAKDERISINNAKMTNFERKDALAALDKKIKAARAEARKAYNDERNELRRQFFLDAREEFGYGSKGEEFANLIEERSFSDAVAEAFDQNDDSSQKNPKLFENAYDNIMDYLEFYAKLKQAEQDEQ